jgi:hypothetical protein
MTNFHWYRMTMQYDYKQTDTFPVQSINKANAKIDAINHAIRYRNPNGVSIGIIGIEKQMNYKGKTYYKPLRVK